VNHSPQFAHLEDQFDNILLEKNTLQQIIARGPAVCNHYRALWTPDRLRQSYDEIIEALQ
jgi:hypothetical protein